MWDWRGVTNHEQPPAIRVFVTFESQFLILILTRVITRKYIIKYSQVSPIVESNQLGNFANIYFLAPTLAGYRFPHINLYKSGIQYSGFQLVIPCSKEKAAPSRSYSYPSLFRSHVVLAKFKFLDLQCCFHALSLNSKRLYNCLLHSQKVKCSKCSFSHHSGITLGLKFYYSFFTNQCLLNYHHAFSKISFYRSTCAQ